MERKEGGKRVEGRGAGNSEVRWGDEKTCWKGLHGVHPGDGNYLARKGCWLDAQGGAKEAHSS